MKYGSALSYDRRKVVRALARMGFALTDRMAQGDHNIFQRHDGVLVYLPINGNGRKDVAHNFIHAAGLQLERSGVMTRREFVLAIKSNL